MNDIRQLSIDLLKGQGYDVLDVKEVDDLLMRHRIRYLDGIERETSRAFGNESPALIDIGIADPDILYPE